MPQKPKHKLPPLELGEEPFGSRLAHLRKRKGYTQKELADKIGINRVLISDYERERIRPNYEMIIRLSLALGVSTDELLGVKTVKDGNYKPNLKIQKRMKKIDELPESQQKALLRTIDTFLKGAER